MAALSISAKWVRPFAGLISLAIVLGLLSWGQGVLIPVALSILLTFVLTPAVSALQRLGLGRTPAVILVVALTSLLFAGLGGLVTQQLASLAHDLPTYTANSKKKLAELRELSKGGPFETVTDSIKELEKGLTLPDDPEKKAIPPIRVVQEPPSPLSQLMATVSPLLGPLGATIFVLMLIIFMLINREDLRNRLFALIGPGRIAGSTIALDDAGRRVGRYLLMQLAVNAIFGTAVGIGLVCVGVPYALVWGLLATLLRYIPYVGPVLAALPPVIISIGTSPGWVQPFFVFGLFLVLAVVIVMVVEPPLYGRSIGVSPATLIVALAFWTWLWGWMGLILGTPLTVCLVVLGRHVPALKFFDVLLGDQPALEAPIGYYQRLLARDQDEASDNAEDYLKNNSLQQVYDEVLIPAVIYAERDLDNGDLTPDDHRFILKATEEIVEELATLQRLAGATTGKVSEPASDAGPAALRVKVPIMVCPARDEADTLALQMFQELLDPSLCAITLTSTALLASELVTLVEEKNPAVICIASLPPGGLARCRYLCLRLRARFPELKIVIGRWGIKGDLDKSREHLLSAGADHFTTTLLETRNQVSGLVQHLEARLTADGELGQPGDL